MIKNTINVAIVDDEKEYSGQLYKLLQVYASNKDKSINVEIYDKPASFMNKYTNKYDILFFDIQMPSSNGLELAEFIRKMDERVLIVFVTNFEKYALDGYSVHAFDFLLKPVNYIHLERMMNRACITIANNRDKMVVVKYNGSVNYLNVNDIVYIDVLNRTVTYHTLNGDSYNCIATLSSVEKEVAPFGFIRSDHSHIVNIHYIEGLGKDSLVVGKNVIPIARGSKQTIVKAIAQFLEKQ